MDKIIIWRSIIFCCLLLETGENATYNTLITEEGKPAFLSIVSLHLRSLIWQFQDQSGKSFNISRCDINGTCEDLMPFSFRGSRNVTINESSLQVVAANRNISFFKCIEEDTTRVAYYNISVYVKPENASCRNPEVYNSSHVSVTCSTERIYPGLRCNFLLTHPHQESITNNVVYMHITSELSPGSVITTCTQYFDVTARLPAVYLYNVTLRPNYASISIRSAVHVSGKLVLKPPSLTLSKNCRYGKRLYNKYIDGSMTTTCGCELANIGFPPGQAVWYDECGSLIGNSSHDNRTSIVVLHYNPKDPEQKLECGAITNLNVSIPHILYQPKYAYGPFSVAINTSKTSITLCQSDLQYVIITCTVPDTQVNPAPRFSVIIDSHLVKTNQTGNLTSAVYTFIYNFKPNFTANFQVECKAENSQFPYLQVVSSQIVIEVKEMPMPTPDITVRPTVTDLLHRKPPFEIGDEISVTCTVYQGLPVIAKVTLDCGIDKTEVNTTQAMLILIITENLDGQICWCNAEHVANCYSQKAHIVLSVKDTNVPPASKSTVEPITIGLAAGVPSAILISSIVVILVCLRLRTQVPEPPISSRAIDTNYLDPVSSGYANYAESDLSSYRDANSPSYLDLDSITYRTSNQPSYMAPDPPCCKSSDPPNHRNPDDQDSKMYDQVYDSTNTFSL